MGLLLFNRAEECDSLTACWMWKLEHFAVQAVDLVAYLSAVQEIAVQRVTYVRHMYTQLVGPARYSLQLNRSIPVIVNRDDVVYGRGGLAVITYHSLY